MENNKDTFEYVYSAEQQVEIEKIRNKYMPKQEDKLEQLRKLDAKVTRKATSISLATGIIGILILGSGMSFIMTDLGKVFGIQGIAAMATGIAIGLPGIVMVSVAYPLYCKVLKKEREKAAPEILKITEALIK